MDAYLEPNQSIHDNNKLAAASFVMGLVTMIFPIISTYYLIAANGGPGYVQSLFCGIPLALTSIIIGGVSLVQIKGKNRSGAWMAILGIVLGSLVFIISCVMLAGLIMPFFMGFAG